MITEKQIKAELTEACREAVSEWLKSLRGANALGPNADMVRINDTTLQIRGHIRGKGLVFFQIKIKQDLA